MILPIVPFKTQTATDSTISKVAISSGNYSRSTKLRPDQTIEERAAQINGLFVRAYQAIPITATREEPSTVEFRAEAFVGQNKEPFLISRIIVAAIPRNRSEIPRT